MGMSLGLDQLLLSGGRGGSAAAPSAPAFVSAAISNATPTKVVLTYDRTLGTSTTSTPGDFTLASAGGRTISSVARVGATIELTVNTAFVFGVAPTIAVAAGKVFESTNVTAAGALSATAITNNVVAFQDNFNRANSGTLGTASGLFTWLNPTLGIGIVSNKANGVGFSDVNTGFSGALTLIAKVTSDLSGFTFYPFWGDGTANNLFALGVTPTTGLLQIFKIVGGSYSLLFGAGLIPVVAGVETTIQLVVAVDGSNWDFTPTVNGVGVGGALLNSAQTPFGSFAGITHGAAADTTDDWSITSP